MTTGKIPWGRLAAEGLLIVASVYLAIVLEGNSQDRARGREATAALAQLLGELREDRADLDEVRAKQLEIASDHETLMTWFREPASLSGDSVTAYLDAVGDDNRTMFPRRSAWTTMVASGQLTQLGDPGFVTQLANLYENINTRLNHNGSNYDQAIEEIYRRYVPEVWDPLNARLLTPDPAAIATLGGRFEDLRGWNEWYLGLLDQYETDLDGLITAVDEHLRERGWEG